MKIKGVCDFCEKEFDNEGGLFENRNTAKRRPRGWGAVFVSERNNLPVWDGHLPKGVNFSPTSLERAGITTQTACSTCFR